MIFVLLPLILDWTALLCRAAAYLLSQQSDEVDQSASIALWLAAAAAAAAEETRGVTTDCCSIATRSLVRS